MRTQSLRMAIALALGLGAFALTTTDAAALGLGSIQVKSRLNQVLDAEIPIVQEKSGEAAGLIVQLASAEDFERIGLSRSQVGVPLEFTLAKNASGQTVIKVTSKDIVSAPFLDFLIEANWTNGRVLREYTVLLDPPSMAPIATTTSAPAAPPTVAVAPVAATPPPTPAPAPRVAPPTQPAAVVETKPTPPAPRPTETRPVETKPMVEARPPAPVAVAPAPRAEPKPIVKATPPAPKPSAPPRATDATSYGPVAKGETLSEIARATQPDDSVSANQVMLALLKANPKAFFGNNINNLRTGAVLRIPSADEIRENASMRDAAAKVRAQIDEWRGGIERPTLIAGSSQTPVGTQSGNKSSATGSKGDAHLALVPPSVGKDSLAANERVGGSASGNNGSANAELARTRETLSAREQEAGELRSRVKDLETIKGKNERLLSLKDSEIAELQRKLAEAQGKPVPDNAVAPKDTKPAIDTKPALPKVSSDDIWGKTDTAPTTAAGATPDTGNPPATTPSDSNGQVPPDLAAADGMPTDSDSGKSPQADLTAPKPISSDTALGEPATPTSANGGEQPWYMDIKILGMAAIAALVAVLLGVIAMRRRSPPLIASGARTSIADDYGDSPLAHADRDADIAQVNEREEKFLRDRIDQDPTDLGARLELLSMYYADNRRDEFIAGAQDMHAYVEDSNEPEWRQIVAMGEDIAPHNPLFDSDADAIQTNQFATQTTGEALAAARDSDRWAPQIVRPVEPIDLDSLDAGHAPSWREDRKTVPERFDVSDDNLVDAELGAESLTLDTPLSETDSFSLPGDEIDDDEATEFVSPDRPRADYTAPAASDSDTEFSGFDLPPLPPDALRPYREVTDTGKAPVPAIDENDGDALADDEFYVGDDTYGTKLDLARAYVDMGDPEGARSMLEEVLADGNSEQQDQARRLLSDIA